MSVRAATIVERIMNDLSGRSGVFDGIDEDIMEEIREELTEIVEEEITNA
ncbi:MAG: hypothetical protein JXR12_05930 [Neptunomonas phycophila]